MNSCHATVIVMGVLFWNGRTAAIRSECVGNYCFIISENVQDEILNQTAAQQWCMNSGSQLAEIVSQDVQNAVETFIRGLSINTNGWSFRINGLRSFGNWSSLGGRKFGTDAGQGDGTYYGYLDFSGTSFCIKAATVTEPSIGGYVCTDNSSCSDEMMMADGQCNRSYTQATGLSWYDARNHCLNRSADLASFDYINLNDGFCNPNAFRFSTSVKLWIGIRRESWTWQRSGSDVNYTNWQKGQPGPSVSDNCLCLYGNTTDPVRFKWFSCSCNTMYPFLCLSDKSTSTTTNAAAFSSRSQPDSDFRESDDSAKSGLSRGATIGIGVGVGVGGFLLVVVVVIIIVIKKPYLSKTRNKKQRPNEKQNQNDETMMAGKSGRGAEEGQTEYAEVLRSAETDKNTATDRQQQPPTVYQELDIAKNDSHSS